MALVVCDEEPIRLGVPRQPRTLAATASGPPWTDTVTGRLTRVCFSATNFELLMSDEGRDRAVGR
jgi:hypothetical protein